MIMENVIAPNVNSEKYLIQRIKHVVSLLMGKCVIILLIPVETEKMMEKNVENLVYLAIHDIVVKIVFVFVMDDEADDEGMVDQIHVEIVL